MQLTDFDLAMLERSIERLHTALYQLNHHHTQDHHAGGLEMDLDETIAEGFLAFRLLQSMLPGIKHPEVLHGS